MCATACIIAELVALSAENFECELVGVDTLFVPLACVPPVYCAVHV